MKIRMGFLFSVIFVILFFMSIKDTVLAQLKAADTKNGFISGQELADKCNVSRTAIWKAVNTLKEEGCIIEAVSNRGYRLLAQNIFDQNSIESLTDKNLGVKVVFYPSIDSTNTQCKRLLTENRADKLNHTVVVAAEQTNGRGRLGRTFYSPNQSGIYMSIIYSSQPINNPAVITANTAVAITRAIKKIYNKDSLIKWINDIYIDEKKVSGVLTEGVTNFETGVIDAAIIGIGINITTGNGFPEDIAQKAGSILTDSKYLATTTDYKRAELCAEVINQVLYILDGDQEVKKNAMEEYKEKSFLKGKTIKVTPVIDVEEGSYTCKVLSISDNAELIVQTDDGTIRHLSSGEVTLH